MRLPWWAVEELAEKLASPTTEHERKRAIALVGYPAGWSLRDIARKLGVSYQAVGGWRFLAKKTDPEIYEYVQALIDRVRYEMVEAVVNDKLCEDLRMSQDGSELSE